MGRRQRRQPMNPPPPSGLEACQTQAQDSCRYLQFSDEIRVPPARRSRRPTHFPPCFHSTFHLNPKYFMVFRASEVLRIRFLDASGPRSSKHYANYALWELRIQHLDTSGPRSSIHYANHALWELRIRILDTSGPILLRILLPHNRSIRLSSSGSIHNMMISRGRR